MIIASELLHLHCHVSGTGAMTLDSDLFQATELFFRLPPGMKAKIWAKSISSQNPAIINLEYSYDVTAGTPTWKALWTEELASSGELILEKRSRPLVLHSFSQLATEGFRLNVTTGTGDVYVDLDVEISSEDD